MWNFFLEETGNQIIFVRFYLFVQVIICVFSDCIIEYPMIITMCFRPSDVGLEVISKQ